MKKLFYLLFSSTLIFSVAGLAGVGFAQNFIGPSGGAGTGQGAIGLDSSYNLAVGTSTPQSDTKLLIVGTSTGASYFAIKVLDVTRGPLFVVRSDGSVSIGGGQIVNATSGATSTVPNVGNAPSNGALFVNGPIFNTLDIKTNGLAVGTSTPQSGGNIYAAGTITSANFGGTVSAANVTAGVFGAGNFSFPSSVGIATSTQVGLPSTLSVYGTLSATGRTRIANGSVGTKGLNFLTGNGGADASFGFHADTTDVNNLVFGISSVNRVVISNGSGSFGGASTGGIVVAAGGGFQWSNSTNAVATIDTALMRNATSVIEVNNGTAGTLATLLAAKIGLATTTPTNPLSVQGNANISGVLTVGSCTGCGGLWTASGTAIYYNSGNVGIGTTNPGVKLEVSGAGLFSSGATAQSLKLTSTDATAYSGTAAGNPRLSLDGPATTNTYSTLGFQKGGATYAEFGVVNVDNTNSRGDFVWKGYTGGAWIERMRVNYNGDVGIGTTAPTVLDAGGVSPNRDLNVHHASGPGVLTLSSATTTDGGVTGAVLFGSTGASGYNLSATILSSLSGAAGTNAAGILAFYTNPSTAAVERMRIDKDGNVGIAMTNPSVALDVTGNIEYTGTITDVSDERLKENIADISSALSVLSGIQGKSFNMVGSTKKEYGFIAQNVQAVLPEAVSVVDPEKGHLGVDYISFIPFLVEGVKEQQAEIDVLKSENAALKKIICADHPREKICEVGR